MPHFPIQVCRCFALLLCVAVAGCAPLNKYSFETFSPQPAHTVPGLTRSDLLALIYADYVARLLEGRSTGARITRELSDSSLAVGGALLAAKETLEISAEAVAHMGVGIVIVQQLQKIFNAGGRSEAFADAAYLIRQAQNEYRQFNPNPSPTTMTENGAILVSRVDGAVYAAQKTLTGRLPALLDLKQATQPMTKKGAERESFGTPRTMFNAAGDAPLPTGITKEDIQAAVTAEVKKIQKQPPGERGKVTVVPVKQDDFRKRVGVQTLALTALKDAEMRKVYADLYPDRPLLPEENPRQMIFDALIGIKNTPARADGTIPPDAVTLLDTYERAIGGQAP